MKMKDIWARRGVPNASSWIRQWLSIYWLRCIHIEWKFWLSGGSEEAPQHMPPRPKNSQFHAVLLKFWQNHMLAPHAWKVGTPRKGNRGSAPVTGSSLGIKCTIYIGCRQRSMKIFAVTYSPFRQCKLALRVRSHWPWGPTAKANYFQWRVLPFRVNINGKGKNPFSLPQRCIRQTVWTNHCILKYSWLNLPN